MRGKKMFYSFFTNSSSTSNATYEDSKSFIADVLRVLKVEQKKIATSNFSFVPTTFTIVETLRQFKQPRVIWNTNENSVKFDYFL